MKALLLSLCLIGSINLAAQDISYQYVPNWPTLPEGRDYMGNGHGEVRVDAAGHIYVSTETPEMPILVFNPDGSFKQSIGDGLAGIHGFIIRADPDGVEYIYAAHLRGQKVVKLTLDGEIVLTIGKEAFPEENLRLNKNKDQRLLRVTSVDVAPNGDIYAVDGYGNDNIFVFSPEGSLKFIFGGKGQAPSGLNNCHKVFIDPRYEPARVVGCDRRNLRVVHFSLEGEFIEEMASDLRRPSSVDFYGDLMAIAEISGRVVVLDKEHNIVSVVSENTNAKEINTNKTAPELWKDGIVTAPHGICFDGEGNILVSEYNRWGRLLRFDRVQ